MQHRMKTHQLDIEQIEALLRTEQVGTIAVVGADGAPYVTPVHFLYADGQIHLHGLPKGQRMEAIQRDGRVSFNVYRMDRLLLDEEGKPCDTNTQYQSVIIQGEAALVTDPARKVQLLKGIVEKYTPQLADVALPENMVRGTAVVSIRIAQMTGKYWA